MGFAEFSIDLLANLVSKAERSPRRRQHYNLHVDSTEPVQRLFNAIGVDSYIRPHRHCADPKRECLLGLRGELALILFDDTGMVIDCVLFGPDPALGAGVELEPEQWHTVVALTPGSILFEVKQGPFVESAAKEAAPWSPREGGVEGANYLRMLQSVARRTRAARETTFPAC